MFKEESLFIAYADNIQFIFWIKYTRFHPYSKVLRDMIKLFGGNSITNVLHEKAASINNSNFIVQIIYQSTWSCSNNKVSDMCLLQKFLGLLGPKIINTTRSFQSMAYF